VISVSAAIGRPWAAILAVDLGWLFAINVPLGRWRRHRDKGCH
jgi:hypothetical protein